MSSEFLKRKASELLRLARACFDIDTARRLRLMAEEFNEEAEKGEVAMRPFAQGRGRGGHDNGGIGRS